VKLEKAEFVATCTGANQRYLEQFNHTRTPIHTIYHGLDTHAFSAEHSPARALRPPMILAVGRLVEKKGFSYLVQACRQLRDRGFEFQCLIVGEPDEQTTAIKQMLKDLKLEDCVALHDAVDQAELREIYAAATVFALPCQIVSNGDRDGIPNVLVEAMAMELPVVTTHVSGIPELVDDRVNGLLIPERDASALARALAELLSNPSLRRQLGEAARAKVRRSFDSTQTTIALKTLFNARLQRQPRPDASPAGRPVAGLKER
jgi:glycosyltransferase involved in cell wall biosynthesis